MVMVCLSVLVVIVCVLVVMVCVFVVVLDICRYVSAHRDTAEETRAMMWWFHDPFSHRVRSLRAPSHGVSQDPRSERVDGRRGLQ